ncbi:2-aminoethylphosphonate aminotransferase [Shewanella surugensis]|uniref:2-aminoethylphosphonate--pyruvate transaminase n=1 Tax=Shewanella surugensis TaxID=212020 RepID=A0ABT0LJC0_9GAMM|nr:2-aminoethylphosphonate--pyruvate transaminase [Shewanella surugensis]MCL1127221.1 2-aminoethylphosphonate--pyruvate transaminase [Shewanella surugensis]
MQRSILLTPGPATTSDNVKYAQIVPDICPREQSFGELIREVCNKILLLANGENTHHCVLFGGSGTAAVEACISSVIPDTGKVLIIVNGAYGERIAEMCKVYYRSSQYEIYQEAPTKLPCIDKIEKRLQSSPEISHITVVHHETTTGILNPLEEIFALAKNYGKSLIVDAMSSFGGIDINLDKMPCHYLIASSNKNLQGMAGIGFVLCEKKTINTIANFPKKTLYLDLYSQYQSLLLKNEMRFTPPVQTIYALNQALNEILEEGLAQRISRYSNNWQCLVEGMAGLGFNMAIPDMPQSKILTTFLEPDWPNFSFETMHDFAFERGFTIYPGKTLGIRSFRLAIIGDIYENDILNFVIIMQSYVKKICYI